MKHIAFATLKGSVLTLALLTLSGCDMFKKKGDTDAATKTAQADDAALCSINGKTAVTQHDFDDYMKQMVAQNPYFRGADPASLPQELKQKVFEQLVTTRLIEAHADTVNVEKDPEYIKAFQEAEKQLKSALKVQILEKQMYDGIKVEDTELQKYYDENKARFVKTPGGVQASGVRFETDQAADAFLAKAKTASNFETLAKAEKTGKFRDFGRVTKEVARGMQFEVVPAPVKDTVLAAHDFPSVHKVKAGKDIWVVAATDKQDVELFPLDEVKQHVEAMLKQNKFRDVLEAKIKDIRGKMEVVTNDAFFATKQAEEGAVQQVEGDAKNTAPVAATTA